MGAVAAPGRSILARWVLSSLSPSVHISARDCAPCAALAPRRTLLPTPNQLPSDGGGAADRKPGGGEANNGRKAPQAGEPPPPRRSHTKARPRQTTSRSEGRTRGEASQPRTAGNAAGGGSTGQQRTEPRAEHRPEEGPGARPRRSQPPRTQNRAGQAEPRPRSPGSQERGESPGGWRSAQQRRATMQADEATRKPTCPRPPATRSAPREHAALLGGGQQARTMGTGWR